jgi:hypothetical protein
MHKNATIILRKDRVNNNIPIEIIMEFDRAFRYHWFCLMFTLTRSLQIGRNCQNILMENLILNTVSFTDDQVIVASTKEYMH